MENSETQEKVIKLGKQLAKNIEDIDEIGQWMAHYIAEQIAIVESDSQNESAKKQCFETILKLWHHRAYSPRGTRPFEQFDAIFQAIKNIDPENKYPSYYKNPDSEVHLSEEVKAWVNAAENLDIIARILIEFCFKQAFNNALDEKTKDWVSTVLDITNSQELDVVLNFIPELGEKDESEKQSYKKEKLLKRVEQLNAMEHIANALKDEMLLQIKDLGA